jgi:hypothetical protein
MVIRRNKVGVSCIANILSVSLRLSRQTVAHMWMKPVYEMMLCLPVSKRCRDAW